MADPVTRVYSGFRGVDFRGEECALERSPDSLNMWKDYKETDSVRTRPAFSSYTPSGSVGKTVHGIYFFNNKYLYHVGTDIFRDTVGVFEGTRVCDFAYDWASMGFVYNNVFYFKQRGQFLQTTDGETFTYVKGYVPTTSIGKKPEGGGTVYEDVNMLTGERINTFVADGTSTVYHLDAESIGAVTAVTVNGTAVAATQYTVDQTKGTVTFATAPAKPATEGQDNVSVQFTAKDMSYKIYGCELATVFDNRVFFSGNPDFPGMIWHSSLDDPTYVSDLDYYQEGRDGTPVRGMVAGNNALWVFREPSTENATVFYHTPAIDESYGKIYPASHSSISTGCVGKAINFNDDIVFFSERGMEGISGDVTTEQVIAHRSSLVDRKLTAEEGYKDMVLAEWEGYLLVCIGRKIYLADSRGTFTNGDHTEYEWFYWDVGQEVTCAAVVNGSLLVGTKIGLVLSVSSLGLNVESYWVTPKDRFQYPNRLKTTNKRGCVAEGQGDITVYAKTEDTEFELIGAHSGVTDYFVSRIKRKKFKDLQLKFQTDTRFSLESVTLECFVGGYIKR